MISPLFKAILKSVSYKKIHLVCHLAVGFSLYQYHSLFVLALPDEFWSKIELNISNLKALISRGKDSHAHVDHRWMLLK